MVNSTTPESPRRLQNGKNTSPAEITVTEHFKQWRYIEVLEARLCEVETLFRQSAISNLVDPDNSAITFQNINARIIKLETKIGLSFNTAKKANGRFQWVCPVEDCHSQYDRQNLYHKHSQHAKGHGHRALRAVLDRKRCLPCDLEFTTLQGLTSHERKHASRAGDEPAKGHLTSALPFFNSETSPESCQSPTKTGRDHPCRRIADVFASLAEEEDDQACQRLLAMLFTADLGSAKDTTSHGPPAGVGVLTKKRARPELEDTDLESLSPKDMIEANDNTEHSRKKSRRPAPKTELVIKSKVSSPMEDVPTQKGLPDESQSVDATNGWPFSDNFQPNDPEPTERDDDLLFNPPIWETAQRRGSDGPCSPAPLTADDSSDFARGFAIADDESFENVARMSSPLLKSLFEGNFTDMGYNPVQPMLEYTITGPYEEQNESASVENT
ncbi:MAG: hypothetical protein Q9170_000647 [Blastenia crenularia]